MRGIFVDSIWLDNFIVCFPANFCLLIGMFKIIEVINMLGLKCSISLFVFYLLFPFSHSLVSIFGCFVFIFVFLFFFAFLWIT